MSQTDKQPSKKTPHERLNNLAAVAGRNVVLSLISEVCELNRRLEHQERLTRKLLETLPAQKTS